MGKAAKQARNRELKRKQREERIKANVEYAKSQIEAIRKSTVSRIEVNGMDIPLHLAEDAYKRYIKDNGKKD